MYCSFLTFQIVRISIQNLLSFFICKSILFISDIFFVDVYEQSAIINRRYLTWIFQSIDFLINDFDEQTIDRFASQLTIRAW